MSGQVFGGLLAVVATVLGFVSVAIYDLKKRAVLIFGVQLPLGAVGIWLMWR